MITVMTRRHDEASFVHVMARRHDEAISQLVLTRRLLHPLLRVRNDDKK